MKCNTKQNLISELRDQGLMDKNNVVNSSKVGEFGAMMNRQTQNAINKYNLKKGTEIVSLEKTEGDKKVVFNEEALKNISEKIGDQEDLFFTGIDHDTSLNTDTTSGNDKIYTFTKMIAYKENLSSKLANRLNELRANKNKYAENKEGYKKVLKLENTFTERQETLKKELQILKKNPNKEGLAFYFGEDFKRLPELVVSKNVKDIEEAHAIINFYIAIGTFDIRQIHPLIQDPYSSETGETNIDPEIKNLLSEYKRQAMEFKNRLEKTSKETITKIASSMTDTSFDELTASRGDASMYDMFVMDITNGTFSSNGELPQIMHKYLRKTIDRHAARAKNVENEVDSLKDEVEEILIKKGYKIKVFGMKGVSYDLFRARDEHGNKTNNITQRFSQKYTVALAKVKTVYNTRLQKAYGIKDAAKRRQTLNSLHAVRNKWYKKNTVVVHPEYLAELAKDFPNKTFTENSEYVNNLKEMLGEKGYQEMLLEVKKGLREYSVARELAFEEIDFESELDEKQKQYEKDSWEKLHNPDIVAKNFKRNAIASRASFKYNAVVPRRFGTKNLVTESGTRTVEDKTKDLGFYDERYEEIENSPVLLKFQKLVAQVLEEMYTVMPVDVRKKMFATSIPALQKSVIETLTDPDIDFLARLSNTMKMMIDKIKANFTTKIRFDENTSTIDPITGKDQKIVNSSFLKNHRSEIESRVALEREKLLTLLGFTEEKKAGASFNLDLKVVSQSVLDVIAENLDCDATPEAIVNAYPKLKLNNFNVMEAIKSGVTSKVIQNDSFDLPKILKMYSYLSAEYTARQEVLPTINILKQEYERIQTPVKNIFGKNVKNKRTGEEITLGARKHAIDQMESYYNRSVLGDYGDSVGIDTRFKENVDKVRYDENNTLEKTLKLINRNKSKTVAEKEKAERIEEYLEILYEKLEKIDSEFSETEEIEVNGETVEVKKTEEELEKHEKLKQDTIKEINTHLVDLIKNGRYMTAKSFAQGVLNFVRLKALGWNLSAGVTNFVEGQIGNAIIAASERYFPTELIYRANHIILIKGTATFGQNVEYKKTKKLMNNYRILQDASNELQKASSKSNFSKFKYLHPYQLTQFVEFKNQSPLMIAALLNAPITDVDGNVSNVFDAMGENGRLKEEFRTEENIQNWEENTGADYEHFKAKLAKVIVEVHGDYEELRGMVASEHIIGAVMIMFKRWLPRAIHQRFGKKQMDLETGVLQKGRNLSHTTGTAAMHGGVVGFMSGGIIGGVAGALVAGTIASKFGSKSNISVIRQMGIVGKEAVLNLIRFPINCLTGKMIIQKGNYDAFSREDDIQNLDKNNIKGIVSEISVILGFMMVTIITKGIAGSGDDDDNEDDIDAQRKAKLKKFLTNIVLNKTMQLASQAGSYLRLWELYDSSISSLGMLRFFTDLVKLGEVTEKLLYEGTVEDVAEQTRKTFLPGVTDGSLGFKGLGSRQFNTTPFDKMFRTSEQKFSSKISASRARFREKYKKENPDATKKTIDDATRAAIPYKKKDTSYEFIWDNIDSEYK